MYSNGLYSNDGCIIKTNNLNLNEKLYLQQNNNDMISNFIKQIQNRNLSPKMAGIPLNEAFIRLFLSFIGIIVTSTLALFVGI